MLEKTFIIDHTKLVWSRYRNIVLVEQKELGQYFYMYSWTEQALPITTPTVYCIFLIPILFFLGHLNFKLNPLDSAFIWTLHLFEAQHKS